jgi:hypothetical protein
MKFYLTVSLFFGLFLSCSSNVVERVEIVTPTMFLSKNEMITILVDVQQLESHYHNKFQRPNVYANALDSATQNIFKKHNVTKKTFKENLTFYAQNQDTLFSMYEGVLDVVNDRINSNFED